MRKGEKLANVNDALIKAKIRNIKYQFDHQGKLITMNGSKYENFEHMKQIRGKSNEESKSTSLKSPYLNLSRQKTQISFN